MPPDTACVGLEVDGTAGLFDLIQAVAPDLVRLGSNGVYEVMRWEDPSGARLVHILEEGVLVGVLPSFAAGPGARLSGVVAIDEFLATAEVCDEDGEILTVMTLALEQAALLLGRGDAVAGDTAIVGLDVDTAVFADSRAFARSEVSRIPTQDPEARVESEDSARSISPRVFAVPSFISMGPFRDVDEQVEGDAWIAGEVISSATHMVGQTGQAFVSARVQCFGFKLDVCLVGSDIVPSPGQVIAGTVSLVGSFEDLPTVA